MSIGDIIAFRNNAARNGYAKAAKWMCTIMPNTSPFLLSQLQLLRELQFLCADTEFPGASINTVDARTYGPIFKTPSQPVFNDVTLTFLCREEMIERKFFGSWINFIHGDASMDFRFRSEYATTIIVNKLPDIDLETPTMSVQMFNAYPTAVLPLPVSWADEGFLRFQVQFTYTDHIII